MFATPALALVMMTSRSITSLAAQPSLQRPLPACLQAASAQVLHTHLRAGLHGTGRTQRTPCHAHVHGQLPAYPCRRNTGQSCGASTRPSRSQDKVRACVGLRFPQVSSRSTHHWVETMTVMKGCSRLAFAFRVKYCTVISVSKSAKKVSSPDLSLLASQTFPVNPQLGPSV